GSAVFRSGPPWRRLAQTDLWQITVDVQPAGRLDPLSTSRLKVKIMAEIRRETQHPSGMKLGDILFALFKRKRTIMVWATIGIIAAATLYFLFPPSYESQAKLL